MTNEQVENVMAIAFELARIREEHGAQSGMYLSEVRALRAEVERLAAQAAPTERAPVVQATWPQEVQPDGTVNAVDPADMGASSGAAQAVRMLTEPEIKALTAMVWGAPCSGRDLAIVTSIVRAVEALQPGERPIDPAKGGRLLDVDACIPADGKIGSAA